MSDMPQRKSDRGSGVQSMPQGPTPPTGGEPLQDHAPPEDTSSARLIGEDEPAGDEEVQRQPSSAQEDPEKDVEDWATGDEPMTGPQRSYLETLAREAGEDVPEDLTKAQASQLIDRLQERTGRGQ